MKKIHLIILFISITKFGFAQSVDFDLISYNGLNYYSTKSEIIQNFGQPNKSFDPNYDCGFLSTDSQNEEYLTLDYGKIKFTGNEKQLYVLEKVDFENDNSIIIKYGNHKLTCETDLSDLIKIFGKELEKQFENNIDGAIILFREKADDGIRIEIKNSKLIRLEYWSPC